MDESKGVAVVAGDPTRYRSYLLRLWRDAASTPWRCQVHCVSTGEERRFDSLAGLFAFLEAQVRDVTAR